MVSSIEVSLFKFFKESKHIIVKGVGSFKLEHLSEPMETRHKRKYIFPQKEVVVFESYSEEEYQKFLSEYASELQLEYNVFEDLYQKATKSIEEQLENNKEVILWDYGVLEKKSDEIIFIPNISCSQEPKTYGLYPIVLEDENITLVSKKSPKKLFRYIAAIFILGLLLLSVLVFNKKNKTENASILSSLDTINSEELIADTNFTVSKRDSEVVNDIPLEKDNTKNGHESVNKIKESKVIGSFTNYNNAIKLTEEAKAKHLEVNIVSYKKYYRVWVTGNLDSILQYYPTAWYPEF